MDNVAWKSWNYTHVWIYHNPFNTLISCWNKYICDLSYFGKWSVVYLAYIKEAFIIQVNTVPLKNWMGGLRKSWRELGGVFEHFDAKKKGSWKIFDANLKVWKINVFYLHLYTIKWCFKHIFIFFQGGVFENFLTQKRGSSKFWWEQGGLWKFSKTPHQFFRGGSLK